MISYGDPVKQSVGEQPKPASWSDDPNCASCARVISARELAERGLDRCPFCGGELIWPAEGPPDLVDASE
jgi:predicted RNA-binding Zn-ribbon protein involved in translation (DUF1610 family)